MSNAPVPQKSILIYQLLPTPLCPVQAPSAGPHMKTNTLTS